MLSDAEVAAYRRDGFIVVENVFSDGEVTDLRRVTDEFVERSRSVTEHDDIYDLEPGHTADHPRVRRLKTPHRHHAAYAAAARHPNVLRVLRSVLGPAIKFDTSKLNMKAAGGGAAVEWHQDWAFYPHTNDDLCAVGIMIDDCEMVNGPLLCVPGSHRGPIYDHHADGAFCGAIDAAEAEGALDRASPCLGRAGSISVHHVRTLHGSAPNVSERTRRLFLLQYRAADAWPLLPPARWHGLDRDGLRDDGLVCGDFDPVVPRMVDLPVRLPLPPARHGGSIYEMQRGRQSGTLDTIRTLSVLGAPAADLGTPCGPARYGPVPHLRTSFRLDTAADELRRALDLLTGAVEATHPTLAAVRAGLADLQSAAGCVP